MVCGSELVYATKASTVDCSYCGGEFTSSATCVQGHFVCDRCHSSDAIALIESACLSASEVDMVELFMRIRSHKSMPLHGPEFHALIPAVILTTYRNLGGNVTDDLIRTGIQRGARIPGGSCGNNGICATAMGVGIAFSIILGATPTTPVQRSLAQTMTAEVLTEIAALEAARCCQRESLTALLGAARLSAAHLPVTLVAEVEPVCEQWQHNRECIYAHCPFFGDQVDTDAETAS